MHIRWQQLDHRLRGVDGLDDVLIVDLNFLCRQMQPPVEQQYRCGAMMLECLPLTACSARAPIANGRG